MRFNKGWTVLYNDSFSDNKFVEFKVYIEIVWKDLISNPKTDWGLLQRNSN